MSTNPIQQKNNLNHQFSKQHQQQQQPHKIYSISIFKCPTIHSISSPQPTAINMSNQFLTFSKKKKWSINSSARSYQPRTRMYIQRIFLCPKYERKLLYCHHNKNIYSTSLFKYSFVIKKTQRFEWESNLLSWWVMHTHTQEPKKYFCWTFIKFVAAAVAWLFFWCSWCRVFILKWVTSVNITNEKL